MSYLLATAKIVYRCKNRCNLLCSRHIGLGVLTALVGSWLAGACGEVGDAAGHRRYAGHAGVGDNVDKE